MEDTNNTNNTNPTVTDTTVTDTTSTDPRIEELSESNKTLIERINFLEQESKKAYDKRDKTSKQLKELKQSKVEEHDVEYTNIKSQLDEALLLKDKANQEFVKYKEDRVLQDAIQKVQSKANTANPETFEILESLLKKDTKVENGQILYTNPDGSTRYDDGKILDIETRLNQIRENPAYSGLFAPIVAAGSGSKATTGGVGNPSISGMNHKQKGELISKIGQEKYLELVKAEMNH